MKISASTNPCPEDKLLDYVKELENANCDMIHCDRMDGHFVAASCLPASIVKDIHQHSSMYLDCHLMSVNPLEELESYAKAGASIVTIHYETIFCNKTPKQVQKIVNSIRQAHSDLMLGIAINPETNCDVLKDIVALFDLVLVMSVVPGKSGQSFISTSIDKIKCVKKMIEDAKCRTVIEVDGGVNLSNIDDIKSAGADIVVVGSALYNISDKKLFVNNIKN